jgi:hypothetical protein
MSRKRTEQRIAQTETRKYVLRQRKAERQRQRLLAVLIPILVVVGGIMALGVYREVQQQRQPVARVNNEVIGAATFAKRVQYQRQQVLNTLQSFASLATSSSPDFLIQFATQARNNVAQTVMDQLVDEALVRQEAAARGLIVSEAEVDQDIQDQMATAISPAPTEAPEATATLADTAALTAAATVTGTAAVTATTAPTPTLAAARLETAFTDLVEPILTRTGLSRDDYRAIVRQQLFREKLTAALGAELPITDKQVEATYLLFQDQSVAEQAAKELAEGAAWEEVVGRFQRPPGQPTASPADLVAAPTAAALELAAGGAITTTAGITATAGLTAAVAASPTPPPSPTPEPYALELGERLWMTKNALKNRLGLDDTRADEILTLSAGTASGAVQGGRGFYVIYVFQVDDERELEEAELTERRDGALEPWLEKRRIDAKIDRFPTEGLVPAEPPWFVQAFEQLVGQPQPTLALPTFEPDASGGAPTLVVATPVP